MHIDAGDVDIRVTRRIPHLGQSSYASQRLADKRMPAMVDC